MGFTFEVFPTRDASPSPAQLAERASVLVRQFVELLPIERLVLLSDQRAAQARKELAQRSKALEVRLADDPVHPEGDWLAIDTGEPAGTVQAVRFEPGDRLERSRAAELQAAMAEAGLGERFARWSQTGLFWEVSRPLGQSVVSALAQGFVAAALAEASDGILFSRDGAWDPAVFPCLPERFLSSFMRPQGAVSERYRRLAEERMRELPAELSLFDQRFVDGVLTELVGRLIEEVNRARGDLDEELKAFDRAVERIDTVRILAPLPSDAERDLLIGDGPVPHAGESASAIARLQPTSEEYERWIIHLGELLP